MKNIYHEGKLINKAGVDRVVLSHVELKKINWPVFKKAITASSDIIYDAFRSANRTYYVTEGGDRLHYMTITDPEVGHLNFGANPKKYGIIEFSPANKNNGINIVNFDGKELMEYLAHIKVILSDRYGLEVSFTNCTLKEVELNVTFALNHPYDDYYRALSVLFSDKETIKDIEGKYPSDENEIMLSEDALSQLGMKEPKLNMEIPLSYYDKNGQQEKNFTLSGWFHSYTGTGMGFVSEAYCKNAGYTMAEDGVLSLSLNKMPDDFYRIQKDVELNENQTFGGAVSMKSSSGSVIAMVILLVFFIIGSGYLLIYNVLYISISKDTRFYGLMKTLGTTQKQIKSLVKNQAVKFACIGIPIGIVLATAVSFGIVPFVLNEGFEQGKSMMDAEVFFHPSIYILSILFSAVTVWIACNAPAKAAAKISPIEALKFQNFAPKKTKSRNSTNGGKLHVMAFHNVFRDKKRAILVFMSLFMGITMILGVNGVISSMSAENFIKEYMDYNFEYNDIQFEQPEQLNKEVPQFDEHFVEQIKQIDGVENVDIQKTVWAGIDFDETVLEGFMKIQYEDSRYKSKGQSYEQMIEALKGYADAGDYGCYITTLPDDRVLEEYNVF